MTPTDELRFGELLAILGEVYGPLSALKVQAYWIGLKDDLTISELETAVSRCLRTRKSSDGYPPNWPTPADLIALTYRNLNQDTVADPPLSTPKRLALPEGPPNVEGQSRVKVLIRETIAKLNVPYGGTDPDSPIALHAVRLMARGLKDEVAWRQAEALCQDPDHVRQCDVCTLLGTAGRADAG